MRARRNTLRCRFSTTSPPTHAQPPLGMRALRLPLAPNTSNSLDSHSTLALQYCVVSYNLATPLLLLVPCVQIWIILRIAFKRTHTKFR